MDRNMFSQIAQITDHLYLSSAAAVSGERMRGLGVTHIINCTMDIPNLQLPGIDCIQIHVDDLPTANLSVYFDSVSDKIAQIHKRGGKTLVHCVAGVSRSASLCIAYLMKYYHKNLEDAYRHVKQKRSVIYPNFGFWRQLIEFERRLFRTNSVKMVQSSIGWVPDILEKETRNMVWFSGSKAPDSSSFRYSSRTGRF